MKAEDKISDMTTSPLFRSKKKMKNKTNQRTDDRKKIP